MSCALPTLRFWIFTTYSLWFLGLLTCFWGPHLAHAQPQRSTPSVQHTLQALSQAQTAVVGISATATEGALSSETLDQKRNGTGVVIGENGLTLTIGYLIQEAEHIMITTADGRSLPARTIAYDPATGFGLVQPIVPNAIAKPVRIGAQNSIQEGDTLAVMVGGPQEGGEWGDVDTRLLVSKRPFAAYWEYSLDNALFTVPPLPQHSGAAMFNREGELVGVGSLMVSDVSDDNLQMPGNVFVPTDILKPILLELVNNGSSQLSQRPWLGLTSVEQEGRIRITHVSKSSPAAAAGLNVGDLVLALNGESVSNLNTLYKKLWSLKTPDITVELTVLQGAALRHINIQTKNKLDALVKPTGL